jgi:sugar-phosphatase
VAFLILQGPRISSASLAENPAWGRRPKAAIFDLDGLLVDSEPLWRRAEREIFAEIGLDLSDDDCRSTMGLRCDEVVALWFRRRPWKDDVSPAEVQRRIEERVLSLMRTEGEALPGVDHVLGLVEEAGYKLAVASSSCSALIDAALERLGLIDRFPIRCSAFDDECGKPHPAVFLRAARDLGVEPGNCMVFEDSVAGVEAARRAGMRVIAVPDPDHRDDPAFLEADVVLESLCDLLPGHLGWS